MPSYDGPPMIIPQFDWWFRYSDIKPGGITYFDSDFPVILVPWIWAKPENSMETRLVL